ncbi:MAG TPA: hypothetical protein VH854_04850 [Thermoanaerobaculia bacterium]|jgi:hypothetical protein|nr:hypothetical protein [Thermoanaerobaculia bacterium]
MSDAALDRALATALLGLDALWGGDVMNPSGTARAIVDSWFSDAPMPEAYTHPAAQRLRETGGVAGKAPDGAAVDAYLAAIDVAGAMREVAERGRALPGLRGKFFDGLSQCLSAMWDLSMNLLGRGPEVPYERCVRASTGRAPERSHPEEKRRRLVELLARAGHPSTDSASLLAAADAWRAQRMVPPKTIATLADAFIGLFDCSTTRNLAPHLPADLRAVPRANMKFVPIQDAWFSGFMNYVGRARNADGSPQYEATYEINASLQISVPEFEQLVAHEVVPGHVTTTALMHGLYVRGRAGFESTILAMNTRWGTLAEGIGNNAVLIAMGLNDVEQVPDEDLQIGLWLAHLQDDAKNQASYRTWGEGAPQEEVAASLRRDCLVSEERAAKLSGPWARHPLFGRMNLPAYRAGTEAVEKVRRANPPERALPAIYGCRGIVDVVTLAEAVAG